MGSREPSRAAAAAASRQGWGGQEEPQREKLAGSGCVLGVGLTGFADGLCAGRLREKEDSRLREM